MPDIQGLLDFKTSKTINYFTLALREFLRLHRANVIPCLFVAVVKFEGQKGDSDGLKWFTEENLASKH